MHFCPFTHTHTLLGHRVHIFHFVSHEEWKKKKKQQNVIKKKFASLLWTNISSTFRLITISYIYTIWREKKIICEWTQAKQYFEKKKPKASRLSRRTCIGRFFHNFFFALVILCVCVWTMPISHSLIQRVDTVILPIFFFSFFFKYEIRRYGVPSAFQTNWIFASTLTITTIFPPDHESFWCFAITNHN